MTASYDKTISQAQSNETQELVDRTYATGTGDR